MASPFTTGLSSAAAFGAALMILFGGFPLWMQKGATVAAAFVMSVICAIVVYTVASYKQLRPEALVLTGIALNYLFNALNSTMQFIANEQQLPAIVHWSFGSLTAVTWSDIGIMLFFFAVSFPVFMSQAWAFNLLDDGGDETARALRYKCKADQTALRRCGNSAYSLCSQFHRYHWFCWPGSASYGTYAHWWRLPSSASLFRCNRSILSAGS